jgi:hypothetical protein
MAAGTAIKLYQHYTDPAWLRQAALDAFSENVRATLSLGRLELERGTTLRARQVALTPPGEDTPLVHCEQIVTHVDLGSLLDLEPVPRRIAVHSPTIHLTCLEKDGQWSWNFESVTLLKPPSGEPPPEGLLRDGIQIHNAAISLQYRELYEDEHPRLYEGLDLALRPDPTDPDRWSLEGAFRDGMLNGTHLSGWFSVGEVPRASVRLQASALPAGEAFWGDIPYCKMVWDEIRLRGDVSFTVDLNLDEDGELQAAASCALANGTADTIYYPMPVHSLSGTVEAAGEAVRVKNATGLVDAAAFGRPGSGEEPARVRVNGFYPPDGRPSVTEVQVTDLPLCEKAVKSIPEVGPDLWKEIEPEGRCDLDLAIVGDDHVTAQCRLQNVTLRPEGLPLSVQQVKGTVRYDTDGVRLHDVTGVIVQPPGGEATEQTIAHVSAEGLYDPEHVDSALRVRAQGLRTTREILRSVPDLAPLWETARPTGILDATAILSDGPEGLQYAVEMDVRDMSLAVKLPPDENGPSAEPRRLSIRQLSGKITYDDEGIGLRGISAIMRQPAPEGQVSETVARLSLDGLYDTARKRSRLTAEVLGLRTTEELFRIRPELAKLWEHARPELKLDATAMLWDREGSDAPGSRVLLQIHGGTAQPRMAPVPLTDVTGSIKVDDGTRVFVEQLRGSLLTGQHVGGVSPQISRIEVSGLADIAADRHEFYLSAHNLPVSEELLRAMPPPGPAIWSEAHPEGIVSVSGKVLYDGSRDEPLSYFLDMDLKDVSASFAAAPVPITGLTGHVLIGERRALSNSLAGIACGGHFQGAAVIYYGASGQNDAANHKSPSFGATVHFRHLGLAELIDHLSRPEAATELSEAVAAECLWRVPVVNGAMSLLSLASHVSHIRPNGLLGGTPRQAEDQEELRPPELCECVAGRVRLALSKSRLWQTPFIARPVRLLDLTTSLVGEDEDELSARPPDEVRKGAEGLLEGTVHLGGVLGGQVGTMASGNVRLSEAQLWRSPFFARLLPLLHLSIPTGEEAPGRGELVFDLVRDKVFISSFSFTGGGMNLTGDGTVTVPDAGLDLNMVVVSAKDEGIGIPLITPVVGWLVGGIQSQLFKVHVGGTLNEPAFQPQLLSVLVAPVTGIKRVLSPIFGNRKDGGKEPPTAE